MKTVGIHGTKWVVTEPKDVRGILEGTRWYLQALRCCPEEESFIQKLFSIAQVRQGECQSGFHFNVRNYRCLPRTWPSLEYMKELRYEKSNHIPVWKKGLCDNDTYTAHLTSDWSKLSQRERAGIDAPPLTPPPPRQGFFL